MASNALLDLFEQSNEDTQILNQYANTNPFEITKPGPKFGKFLKKSKKEFSKISKIFQIINSMMSFQIF